VKLQEIKCSAFFTPSASRIFEVPGFFSLWSPERPRYHPLDSVGLTEIELIFFTQLETFLSCSWHSHCLGIVLQGV